MEYIVILVDRPSQTYVRDFENDLVKVQVIAKGQQMVGLRFRHTRPTMVIDCIEDRTLIIRGEDNFEKWWNDCVLPNAVNAKIIRPNS